MNIGKLDTRGWWAANGSPIFVPQSVKIEHTNVVSEDSGRAESGIMKLTWIRKDIVRVSLKYSALTASEVDYMRNLMQGKEYPFTYWDDGVHYINAYTGDCDYDIYMYRKQNNDVVDAIYRNFSIDAVEI